MSGPLMVTGGWAKPPAHQGSTDRSLLGAAGTVVDGSHCAALACPSH